MSTKTTATVIAALLIGLGLGLLLAKLLPNAGPSKAEQPSEGRPVISAPTIALPGTRPTAAEPRGNASKSETEGKGKHKHQYKPLPTDPDFVPTEDPEPVEPAQEFEPTEDPEPVEPPGPGD